MNFRISILRKNKKGVKHTLHAKETSFKRQAMSNPDNLQLHSVPMAWLNSRMAESYTNLFLIVHP